jgi:hypothetical protein
LTDLVLDQVSRNAGVSLKQLGNLLPLKKSVFLETLTRLTETGRILCRFRPRDAMPLFHVPQTPPHAPPAPSDRPETRAEETSGSSGPNDRSLFRRAYEHVGKGRGFVRIHRLREHLGWSRERFDALLREFRNGYVVQLHGGDPSSLTEAELRNSFMDEKGMLFITLTWRGPA